jgi:hypothetical protein
MDKRQSLNNTDKIKLLEGLLNTDIDNKIDIFFYARSDEEFRTLMVFCRKQDLHEKHINHAGNYWVNFHNGYNEEDFISANIRICVFEPSMCF